MKSFKSEISDLSPLISDLKLAFKSSIYLFVSSLSIEVITCYCSGGEGLLAQNNTSKGISFKSAVGMFPTIGSFYFILRFDLNCL
jgi:hypothetical protein